MPVMTRGLPGCQKRRVQEGEEGHTQTWREAGKVLWVVGWGGDVVGPWIYL